MVPHYLRNHLPWPAPFSNPLPRLRLGPRLHEIRGNALAPHNLTAASDAPIAVEHSDVQRADWQAHAIDAYEHFVPLRQTGLTATFTDRVLALTGTTIPRETVFVDAAGQLAVVRIDGVTFRMDQHGHLVVLRGCAWCGTGEFESPRITGPESLGFALGHWTPLHEGCNDDDPSED